MHLPRNPPEADSSTVPQAGTGGPHGGGRGIAQMRGSAGMLALAVVLAAVNLRTAVTSVGPVLDELESGIGLSPALAGVLTTLPVLSFALLGALTPAVTARVGTRRALLGALTLMTAGLLLRALTSSVGLFLLWSVLALAGGALGNVVMPVLVKARFPDRIGAMTAAYTTAMAVGTTLAAAATVPIAQLRGGMDWRLGLGSWAGLSGLAVLVWLALPAGEDRDSGHGTVRLGSPMLRSRTAWALTLFFAAQSMQAYIAFGWFPSFFRERAGVSSAHAGTLVAFLAALSIPTSMIVPSVAARLRSQRPLVVTFVGCYLLAYAGMILAPRAGAWPEVVLAGIGAGAFPLALTLIGLRSRAAATTAALSTVVQSVGYLLAGTGPLLVGVLHGITGGWRSLFVVLFLDLAVMAVSGWFVATPRIADDDIEDIEAPAGKGGAGDAIH